MAVYTYLLVASGVLHVNTCCESSPHLGHAAEFFSFRQTKNLPTRHTPDECLEMNIILEGSYQHCLVHHFPVKMCLCVWCNFSFGYPVYPSFGGVYNFRYRSMKVLYYFYVATPYSPQLVQYCTARWRRSKMHHCLFCQGIHFNIQLFPVSELCCILG